MPQSVVSKSKTINYQLVDSKLTTTALNLMERMLVLDPKTRVSAAEALDHSYFLPYRDDFQETVEEEPFHWPVECDGLALEIWKKRT